MHYIEINGALVNLENGHTFKLEEHIANCYRCHRILSNGNPIMEGKHEEIKKAFEIIKERVLNNISVKTDLISV